MAKVFVTNAFWTNKGSKTLNEMKKTGCSHPFLDGETVEFVVLYSNNTYETFELKYPNYLMCVILKQGERLESWERTCWDKTSMDIIRWLDIGRLKTSGFTKRQAHKYIAYKRDEWYKRAEYRYKESCLVSQKPFNSKAYEEFIANNPRMDDLVYSEPKELKRTRKRLET